jgi:hypothetical protein
MRPEEVSDELTVLGRDCTRRLVQLPERFDLGTKVDPYRQRRLGRAVTIVALLQQRRSTVEMLF